MNDVQNTLLVIHILLATVLIGPIVLDVLLLPGLIRKGSDGLPVLKWLHGIAKVLGRSNILVLILGVILVLHSDKLPSGDREFTFRQAWVSASLTLFILMLVIGLVFIPRAIRKAISSIEAGADASEQANLVTIIGGANTALVIIILVLMIWRPGT